MARLGRPGRELRSFLWRSSIEDQVDAELDFHMEMLARELVEGGLSRDAALAEARRRFGDVAYVNATCRRIGMQRDREVRRTEYLSELRQDIIYAIRQFVKAPAFSLVAILTLALGIGATTALFSAVQSVVLRRFAFANPERTVFAFERWQDQNGSVSVGNYTDYKAMSKSFAALGAVNYSSFSLSEGDSPERVLGARVTPDFFEVFGVRPQLGRLFTAAEDEPGQEQVVVLSHELWQRSFGGDGAIVGRELRLNARQYTVVGVMPAGFDPMLDQEQLWVPIAFTAAQRAMHDEHYLIVVGLLKPGVSREQANADLVAVAKVLAERYPKDNGTRSAAVVALPEFLIGNFRERLFIFLGAVGFVLLIACGNVANLLLARGEARSKEIAIRSAIGAGRGRIVRQLLTESLVLGFVASAVGLAIAWTLVRVLVASAPPGIPRIEQTRIDGTVLLFTLALAVTSSLIFGFAPALRAARQNLQSIMKEGGRGAGGARDRVRSGLVIAEVMLALTLLVGAGLLIRSAFYLQRVEPGFDPRGVLTARLTLPQARYQEPAEIVRAFKDVVERVRQSPGVVAVAVTSEAPLGGGGNSNGLVPEGKALDPANAVNARLRMITPGYFSTLRIPIKAGRVFTDRDVAGAERVMIVSQALATRLWPNQDPIGKRVACCEGAPGDPKWKTVVGVMGDVRSSGPTVDPRPEFYLPIEQIPPEAWSWIQRAMTIVARGTTGDGSALTPALRQAVRAVDPSLPLYNISTMAEAMRGSVAQVRFNTMLLTLLGGIGLVLAAVGIYSVIAYFVNLRTHEIGVRMALGATTSDILRLMTWQGLRPVLLGVVLGTVAAYGTTRLLQGSLFGVTATDPLTFIGVVVMLVVVGILASAVPARRAAKVDPTKALNV